MDQIITIFTIVTLFICYFLPALISRKNKSANAICLLNIVFGWTFIGWFIALAWAISGEEK